MCDACVMEAVKERMLSRRSLFRGLAAAGAASALGAAGSASGSLAMSALRAALAILREEGLVEQ